MENTTPTRISDKLSGSIERLYKAGGLGLVFIFIGMLSMLFAFLYTTSSLATPMFIIGSILLLSSFILFIIVQYNGPVKTKQVLKENKEVIDGIQDLSIKLTKLTYNVQSYCFKNVDKIQTAVVYFSPLIKPFLGEKGKEITTKIENVSAGIVEYSQATEKIISDIKIALEKGDFQILKSYTEQLNELNAKFQIALKEKE